MSLGQVAQVQLPDQDAMRAQTQILDRVNQLSGVPFMDGRKITASLVNSATNVIEHKLGREPLGYFITKQNASASIFWVSWDSKIMTLNSSASVTIDVWVF